MRVLRKSRKLKKLFPTFCLNVWETAKVFLFGITLISLLLFLTVTRYRYWTLFAVVCQKSEQPIDTFELLDKIPSFTHPIFSLYLDEFPPLIGDLEWNENVYVHVVPFSHTDPGWLMKKDAYYNAFVSRTIDNVVEKLVEEPSSRFVWTEVIFLKTWYNKAKDKKRALLRRAVRNGQLEIAYPGYVMQDEALPDLSQTITNFISGASWIQRVLNTSVESSFVADPFGLTSSSAYFQAYMNVSNMYIQRINHREKEYLAAHKQLEFTWETKNHLSVFTSVSPYKLYSIPYSCGPDPRKCCAFDFWRRACNFNFPWQKSWDPGTVKKALEDHVHILAEQYRYKSSLFRTNHVLVLLGDDFRYSSSELWEKQVYTYKKIFEIFDKNKQYKIEAKFSTFSEYFRAVRADLATPEIPNLHGDFVPYTDRWSEFWSGYYTTRPFLKSTGNRVSRVLDAAEMLLMLCLSNLKKCHSPTRVKLAIESSRDIVGNFLHHDIITGTSKQYVMDDFIRQLEEAEKEMLTRVTPALLEDVFGVKYRNDEHSNAFFVFNYNSIPYKGPLFLKLSSDLHSCYELKELIPRGTWTTTLMNLVPREKVVTVFVEVYAMAGKVVRLVPSKHSCSTKTKPKPIWNNFYEVIHGQDDAWKAKWKVRNVSFNFQFEAFGTYTTKPLYFITNPSGAYTFTYDGTRETLQPDCGHGFSSETEFHRSVGNSCNFVSWSSTLFQDVSSIHSRVIELSVTSDIRHHLMNQEFAIVFRTSLKTQLEFYTDSNCMFPMRRKYRHKLSLPGNVYPMSCYAQITDGKTWFTLVTDYAHGVTSTSEGELVLFLDRIHSHDDWRGLNEGIMDNVPVNAKIWISVSGAQSDGMWLAHHLRRQPLVVGNLEFLNQRNSSLKTNSKLFSSSNQQALSGCSFNLVNAWNDLETNSSFVALQKLPDWRDVPDGSFCEFILDAAGALSYEFDNFVVKQNPLFFVNSSLYDLQVFKIRNYKKGFIRSSFKNFNF